MPKPLVPFANKAMILHQIEALVAAGVTEVVLAVNYRPEIMENFMREYELIYNIKIHFSIESEPLGTAGPLALAKEILGKDDSPFFVLNSDVICEYPFAEMAAFHASHGGEGTILVTRVDDPSKYGVVVNRGDTSLIDRFVEKPTIFVSNKINAGLYMFNPSILDRIAPTPTSIEKEIFPLMSAESQLHAMDLPGFWMDIDYIIGIGLYLASLAKKDPSALAHGKGFVGNVLVHPTAQIGKFCKIGPNVVIGENVVIGDGVSMTKTAVFEGSNIKDNSWISTSIIGWHSTVGRWTRIEGVTVLGDDVHIADEIYINGGSVLPHKSVSVSVPEPAIVM